MDTREFILLNLSIAVKSLRSFRVRSLLAMSGVLLGSLSLIIVYNISLSISQRTEAEIERLGKNMLIVRSGVVRRFGSSVRLFSDAATLTVEDSDAIQSGIEFVEVVSPVSSSTFPVRAGSKTLYDVLIVGTTPDYERIRNQLVQRGEMFSGESGESLERTIVVGKKIEDGLFDGKDPIGKYVLVYRAPCRIIGVLEEKGEDASGVDQDRQILMPIETFQRRFVNRTNINMILVRVSSESAQPYVKRQIQSLLRVRHHISDGDEDDFTVLSSRDLMELKEQAMRIVNVLGKIAALVSFAIGGIGILSIMVLIVNERHMEIGMRRAVGSRKRDIVMQFMMESAFISLAGSVAGLALGMIVTAAIYLFSSLPLAFSPVGVVLSFLASMLIGVGAGVYPARKAVRIQPIDIMRR